MNPTELAAIWPPTVTIARKAGHKPISPVEAIRRKCLDCTCQQPVEVKLCEAVTCSLWPFRSGRHPYTKTRLLEAVSEESQGSGTPAPANLSSPATSLQEAYGAQGEDI